MRISRLPKLTQQFLFGTKQEGQGGNITEIVGPPLKVQNELFSHNLVHLFQARARF